ncbi:MAG: hypothetical protein HQL88_02415 [Magnetococcales bacterium]|nr:hypothetical protein [Magnetococcales bacterium]
MVQESTLEEQLTCLIREQLRGMLKEPWLSEWVANVVREEAQGRLPQPPAGLDDLVRATFLPCVHRIARQMARAQVAQDLPDVAERMILAELGRSQ